MTDELKPWSVTASRITYRDRWITLRSDDCLTDDGVTIAPFHVLEYPDWINVVPVLPDGRVMLAREYRHGRGEVLLGLVSGGVETIDGDADGAAMEAARRELREETGYAAERFVKVLTAYPNAANQTNTVTSWVATGLTRIAEQTFDPGEKVEFAFAELPDVLRDIEAGGLVMQAMHVAALYAAERWLRGAAKDAT
jgi:8-oxo-dGTP pyrophosphatase MutT (NUDIX family)